ncbi:MAG: hypothetical protein OEM91_14815 [Hyphomicrobiales bacterium]|nr:hypothetical protein [Hyphomicrobiales bacterium]
MKKSVAFLTAIAAVTLSGVATQPASAGIRCQGPDQVSQYGLHRSPWCEDTYLAHIAGYSPRAIRQNPSIKQEACELVGHDIRVQDICIGFRQENGDFVR